MFERWRRYAAQWMASRDRPCCRHGGNLEIIQDLKASAAGNRRSGGDKRPFRGPGASCGLPKCRSARRSTCSRKSEAKRRARTTLFPLLAACGSACCLVSRDRYQQSCACGQLDRGAPALQEEADVILADELERRIKPKGLAVIVKVRHQCMIWRGVRETETTMVTSIMRGGFRDSKMLRSEFLALIKD